MNFSDMFLRSILRVIAFSRHLILKDIHLYSETGKKEIFIEYPCVIVANHVSELDVSVVAYCGRYAKGKTLFTVPAREDILQPNFLVKEFKPKGLWKLILKGIDFTNIVPNLLKLVHAIPVKRPFRDNAKELMKEGKLRTHVEENWEIIANGMLEGKNVFMFPEGTYTDDGYVNSLRRGIGILKEKMSNLKINFVSLSYDHLSFSKPDVHVFLGNLHEFPSYLEDGTVSKYVRDMLGSKLVAHHGNLFSFACFTEEVQKGISKLAFLKRLEAWIEKLKSKNIYLSARFSEKNFMKIFETLLDKTLAMKLLEFKNQILTLTEKAKHKPFERAARFRKANPLLFHKNQLRFHEKTLLETWNEITI